MSIAQSVKRNVQLRRGATATLFGDRRRSWGEFQERGPSRWGLKGTGVSSGDRVAIPPGPVAAAATGHHHARRIYAGSTEIMKKLVAISL
jgi:hypothetical protein